VFRGGVDDVIYPGEIRLIRILSQRGSEASKAAWLTAPSQERNGSLLLRSSAAIFLATGRQRSQ
jgi:hypothetical protein